MKILVCHNVYQQPGGEDQVFEDECRLMEDTGHTVVRYTKHNDQLNGMGRLAMLRNTIWNRNTEEELRLLIRAERPDVMHCHNTFPLISPSAYSAAKEQGVAVVQTLHNYRLLCPGATLLRDGSVCEDCLGKKVKLNAVRHGCYRGSKAASAAVTAMLAWHQSKGTWTNSIDRYIALTEFSRQKFVEAGFPAERISVKPNIVQPDPGFGQHDGGYAVFVGRLAPEKGIDCLLAAWDQLAQETPLKIIGDGPLAGQVKAVAEDADHVEWLGRRPFEEVMQIIARASVLVMPSVWYETFGRTVVEAFACGTPVIASQMGAMQELVDHGNTGLLFEPGNAGALAAAVQQFWNSPEMHTAMQSAARSVYETGFTAESNYVRLIQIYELAMAASSRATGKPYLVTA